MKVSLYTFAKKKKLLTPFLVPLGQRRRFGPAPVEDTPAPQLAQPSPSVYPRSQGHEDHYNKRGRDESPVTQDQRGKPPSPEFLILAAMSVCALFILNVHEFVYPNTLDAQAFTKLTTNLTHFLSI